MPVLILASFLLTTFVCDQLLKLCNCISIHSLGYLITAQIIAIGIWYFQTNRQ